MKRPYIGWILVGIGYVYGLSATTPAFLATRQPAILVGLSVIIAGCYFAVMTGIRPGWRAAALLVGIAAALGIGALGPFYGPLGFTYIIAWIAAFRLPLPAAIAVIAADAAGITAEYLLVGGVDAGLIFGTAMGTLATGAFAIVVRLLVAARRQNEITARARAEAAVLAERQRLAREMHDLLAHTLSAQIVHLEGARLLLEHDRGEQARQQVTRAVRLARDGLSETKRALEALRGDEVRLADRLAELASDFHGKCDIQVVEPDGLTTEAQWAIIRTAQEALTNVRKHASGAHVSINLTRKDGCYELEVADTGGKPGALADAGGGYGLTGMRERAELLGGSLAAGPAGDGFRVRLTVPA